MFWKGEFINTTLIELISAFCHNNQNISLLTWVFSLSVDKFEKGIEWQAVGSPLPCKDSMDALI